jgi:hypothetical protein
MLLSLASAVFLGSESFGTRDHILLSQIWDFPFRRPLWLAGSRWRYSTPPPHGSVWVWINLAQDMDYRRALVNTVMNFEFRKMLLNSWVAERLAASQEGFSSMMLVNILCVQHICRIRNVWFESQGWLALVMSNFMKPANSWMTYQYSLDGFLSLYAPYGNDCWI